MTSPSLARSERAALCDLAAELGPGAPTLCDGWDAHDLVAHLLLRERSLLGAPGLVVPPLSFLTDREMARLRRKDFRSLVDKLRSPGLTPYALPAVDRLLNTLEYFVHHEDLRRARPGWDPRPLAPRVQDALWRAIRTAGRGLVRDAGVPVTLRRSDTGETATLKGGADPVVVSGEPAELVLFCFGRRELREVTFAGPDDAVARLRAAKLGL